MKLRLYKELLRELELNELNIDQPERNQMLQNGPFSIIIEAGHMELDSLNEWIRLNLNPNALKWLYYGKTGYDYGFIEYFGANKEDVLKTSKVIHRIFTVFSYSSPPNQISRTDGYNNWIDYEVDDKDAIVIRIP